MASSADQLPPTTSMFATYVMGSSINDVTNFLQMLDPFVLLFDSYASAYFPKFLTPPHWKFVTLFMDGPYRKTCTKINT